MKVPDFSNVNVLVIGDVMLDRYIYGSVNRVSPEAPVPVVQLQKTILSVGGAANVAANIVGLGAKVSLVGIIGVDMEASELTLALSEINISPDDLYKKAGRKTTVKTRVIAQNHHIVRIDQETTEKLSETDERIIWSKIELLIENAAIVVISDYAKGMLTDNLISLIILKCNETSKKIIVDPKGNDFLKYQGATILTPNRKEAFEAHKTNEIEIEIVGKNLIADNNLSFLLITEGEDGMTLFQKNEMPTKFSSVARKVFDVTGAGDTVIATLSVTLGYGMDLIDSVKLANVAAGLVVEKVGTTTVELKALQNHI